jgi:Domain of unknown function (DUF5659)
MSKSDIIVIHSRKLAIYLQCKGFVLLGVERNLKNSRKVFLFRDTETLRQEMSKYKNDQEFHAYLSQLAEGR